MAGTGNLSRQIAEVYENLDEAERALRPGREGERDTREIVLVLHDAVQGLTYVVNQMAQSETIMEEYTKTRRALAKFINAYANFSGGNDQREVALFEAFLAGTAALGIQPTRVKPEPFSVQGLVSMIVDNPDALTFLVEHISAKQAERDAE